MQPSNIIYHFDTHFFLFCYFVNPIEQPVHAVKTDSWPLGSRKAQIGSVSGQVYERTQ
jgi:hypothetical protein